VKYETLSLKLSTGWEFFYNAVLHLKQGSGAYC